MVFRLIWMIIPKEGRVPVLFLGVSTSALSILAILRVMLFYSGRAVIGSAMAMFLALTALSIVVSWTYYTQFYRKQDV